MGAGVAEDVVQELVVRVRCQALETTFGDDSSSRRGQARERALRESGASERVVDGFAGTTV